MCEFEGRSLEVLKQALKMYEDEMLAQLPTEEELKSVTFSENFEERMRQLIMG